MKEKTKVTTKERQSRKGTNFTKKVPKKRIKDVLYLKTIWENSLVIQWLWLHAPNAGALGSILGQRARFHMPQLRLGIDK